METHISTTFGMKGQTYSSKMNEDGDFATAGGRRERDEKDYRAEGPDPF